jgi:hypothetical protein
METIALVLLVAAFIKFMHYCIGSPSGNEYSRGRIFSIWGRFVATQYAKYQNKETCRIWGKYGPFEGTPEEMENRIQEYRKSNPWNAAGCCSICFGTWVSMLSWLVLVPVLGLNPIIWIFAVAGSVVVSSRIEI